jgi:tetratricopeptide (TPR) repeat protein
VAEHLVMAGRLAEDEPEQSYKHAKAARRLASRVGIVREAAGIAAYHAGEWAEALAELRAARRLGAGDDSYLPVMVDCERGLGRPERALDLIKSPEAERLDQGGRVELRIVESGVRRDMGQYDAAVVTLQIPELRDRRLRPWSMRLFYAYADALAEAGRDDEAGDWFARAAAADRDGDTDAAERYAEIEGLHILDTEEEEDEGVEITDEAPIDEAPTDEAPIEDAPIDEDRGVEAPTVEAPTVEAPTVEAPTDEAPTDEAPIEDAPIDEAPIDEDRGDEDRGGESGADGGEDVGDGGPAGDEVSAEPAAATDIAFMPAEPEVLEASEEDAPQAPAVFLEPKPADGEERPPAGD